MSMFHNKYLNFRGFVYHLFVRGQTIYLGVDQP